MVDIAVLGRSLELLGTLGGCLGQVDVGLALPGLGVLFRGRWYLAREDIADLVVLLVFLSCSSTSQRRASWAESLDHATYRFPGWP